MVTRFYEIDHCVTACPLCDWRFRNFYYLDAVKLVSVVPYQQQFCSCLSKTLGRARTQSNPPVPRSPPPFPFQESTKRCSTYPVLTFQGAQSSLPTRACVLLPFHHLLPHHGFSTLVDLAGVCAGISSLVPRHRPSTDSHANPSAKLSVHTRVFSARIMPLPPQKSDYR